MACDSQTDMLQQRGPCYKKHHIVKLTTELVGRYTFLLVKCRRPHRPMAELICWLLL